MPRALPYHLPDANQPPIDLSLVMNVCPVDERHNWDAISELLHEAFRMDAFEVHLEPSSDCLRVRFRSLFDFIETRLDIHATLLGAVIMLASRLWDEENTDVARRGWFVFNIAAKPMLFQLDKVACSTGTTYLITTLDDVLVPPARIEDIGLSRQQLTTLKGALERKTGLLIVAASSPQVHRRTSRAIAQSLISPDNKVVMADTPMHPMIPSASQLGLDYPATAEQRKNWRALCQMGVDAIVATQTLDDEMGLQLVSLAAEKSLVVSSVDADNASGCLARLLGLGVRSETIAQCLNTLVLQHRVRCLCTYCRVGVSPDDNGTRWLAQYNSIQDGKINDWLRNRMRCSFSDTTGCTQCNGTGHRAWLDVFDIVTVTSDVKDALFDADYQYAMTQIDAQQRLPDKLLKLAQQGIISLNEASRLTDGAGRSGSSDSVHQWLNCM